MSDGTLGKIVGGWQVSGLFVAQSGQALTIGGNGTLLNTPGNTAFVNLNGDNKVLGGLGPGLLYFDPTVYSLPAAGVQGNMKRHSGPTARASGSSMARCSSASPSAASRYGEFRVDAYNVTNSVRWANPNVTLQHRDRQHVRPDHRHERQPADASGSGRASCSDVERPASMRR